MPVVAAGPDTFTQLLLQHAAQRPGRPAVREKSRGIWRTMSWQALADDAAALAAALAERGVRRGEHVAVLGDNRPQQYAAICAAHLLGAVVVPLYPDAPAAELAPVLQRTGVTHVFAENQEQVDKLLEALPHCPALRGIVYDEDRGMRHYRQPQLASHAALLDEGRALLSARPAFARDEAARGSAGDTAFVFFTAGATGPAKGVLLTHGALVDRARAAASAERLGENDRTMAYLPPGWIAQNFFSYALPMVTGYCVCCPESSETMLADMREMGPTVLLAPPRALKAFLTQVTMRMEDAAPLNRRLYHRFWPVAQRAGARILAGEAVGFGDRLAYALGNLLVFGPLRDVLGMSQLRAAYTTGDAIDTELLMTFRSLGVNLKQLYGSTEAGLYVAAHGDGQVLPGTVGAAVGGVELKLGAQREILVRSAGLFAGYHGDEHASTQARDGEGFLRTGDAGELGADGQLRVIDRLSSLATLKDGTLLAPGALESRLKAVHYIREAVVLVDSRRPDDGVCALIDIDTAAVGQWADRSNLSFTGHADLASLDEVHGLIAGCVARVNADPALARTPIRRFVILDKELDAADGLLTRTGTLRRGAIAERFGALIDAMFDGRQGRTVAAA
jgi:long-chain acyl-CoA synthetase